LRQSRLLIFLGPVTSFKTSEMASLIAESLTIATISPFSSSLMGFES
jgi:hypothetical protein